MTELMHRIFLAPLRSDVEPLWAHRHWTSRHSVVFGQTPGLLGYVQNRPPENAWAGRTHVCAEVWFEDRNAEKAAFTSPYYLADVSADEARFVDRDHAWLSATTMTRRAIATRTYRVLVFGHTEQSAAGWLADWGHEDVDVFELHRPPPTGGASSALGLWTDDQARARDAAVHFGPLSLLTQPEPVVVPPEAPWSAA